MQVQKKASQNWLTFCFYRSGNGIRKPLHNMPEHKSQQYINQIDVLPIPSVCEVHDSKNECGSAILHFGQGPAKVLQALALPPSRSGPPG